MLRFTIRDVLWLTVVVAVALTLGLAWWNERGRQRRIEVEMRMWVEAAIQRAAELEREKWQQKAAVPASTDNRP